MKLNRKLLASLLVICLMVTSILPVSAAELSATYQKASFYEIATMAYSRMLLFQNGVVPAADRENHYGLIDANGNVVVPFQYASIESLNNGLWKVSDSEWEWDGNQGIIDSTGKTILAMGKYEITSRYDEIHVTDRNSWTTFRYTMDMVLVGSYNSGYYYDDDTPAWVTSHYGYSTIWVEAGTEIANPEDPEEWQYLTTKYDKYYIVYDRDEDWNYDYGLLDPQGNFIIPQGTYSNMYSMYDGQLISVSRKISEDSWEREYGALNLSGDVVIPMGKYNDISWFTNNMVEVSKRVDEDSWESYYGLVDLEGNEIIAPEYSRISYTDRYDPEAEKYVSYYIFVKGDYYGGDYEIGIMNEDLQYTVPFGAYDEVEYDGWYYDRDTITVKKDGKMGLIDLNGNVILPLGDYKRINGVNRDGYMSAVNYDLPEGGMPGWQFNSWDVFTGGDEQNIVSYLFKDGQLVNTFPGKMVITETYWRDLYFSDNNKTGGIMKADGTVVVPPEYNEIETVNGGDHNDLRVSQVAPDQENDWWVEYVYGLYTEEGQKVFDCKYTTMSHYGDGKYMMNDGEHYGVSRCPSGENVIPFVYDDIRTHTHNFLEAYDGETYRVLDLSNNEIIPPSLDQITLYGSGPADSWYDVGYQVRHAERKYSGDVYPFLSRLASGTTTTYADFYSSQNLGHVPYEASNINAKGQFVYRDPNTGLMGLAQLSDPSLAFWAENTPAEITTNKTLTLTAKASKYPISVDGTVINFDAYVLKDENGYDTTFLKLRDVAYALNGTPAQFSVGWDGDIVVGAGEPYEVTGTEMSTPFSGDQTYAPGNSATKLKNDGWNETIDVYSIVLKDAAGNGYTYYKIRDLGQNLGFNVTWDQAAATIKIETDQPYQG